MRSLALGAFALLASGPARADEPNVVELPPLAVTACPAGLTLLAGPWLAEIAPGCPQRPFNQLGLLGAPNLCRGDCLPCEVRADGETYPMTYPTPTSTVERDKHGRITEILDDPERVVLTYDARGRVQRVKAARNRLTATFRYDRKGRLVRETVSSEDLAIAGTTTYKYSADGKLAESDGPDDRTVFTWDGERLIEIARYAKTMAGDETTWTITYDPRRRPRKVTIEDMFDSEVTYVYNCK